MVRDRFEKPCMGHSFRAELWDLSYAETNYGVDTTSWFGNDEEC
jgi:hypothetical protein